jgi:hypothetical protein
MGLVFKANHCQWQWQFSCDILCDNPEDAASLRISTVPSEDRGGR